MWFVYGIIIPAVVVVTVALILKVMQTSQGAADITKHTGPRRKLAEKQTETEAEIEEIVYEEVGAIVESDAKRRAIADTVSVIVGRELEERLAKRAEELRKQFEQDLADKTRSEEIAVKKYKRVLVEKKNTDAVIRSIAEGLVVVDSEGKVVMMNPAAEKMLGVTKKDKMGTMLADNLKKEHMVSMAKAKSSFDSEDAEIEVGANDETKKVLRASSAIIENEDGQTVGMVSMLSDITKQKELDSLKAKFVASVSHELRTPLIAIDKSVTLLLSKSPGPITEPQEQFLSIASRNLKRLTNLINDLLDISKLEAGKLSISPQPASIRAVVDDSIATLSTWASTKGITLHSSIPDSIPDANFDSDRMIQVFNNLIGNAIKFTPHGGGIYSEVFVETDRLVVIIRDTGIGIPKEDLSKIFDKFYQSEGRMVTDVSGTGLGLAIVKEIIELHGGAIWAESEPGKGTKMIFTLPLGVPEKKAE